MNSHVNAKIKIVRSTELLDCKLLDLVGRTGVITEQLTSVNRKNKGYIVKLLGGKYKGELEWFIPKSAVKF
ncbi:MAG: hypothetical protein ACRDD8_09805 [Bacteroidales bacterium]